MLDDDELAQLYANQESDLVERKRNWAKGDEIRQAICAFSNDLPNHGKPGVIFVGQEDDGTCANIQIDDELLRNLGGIRVEGKIHPFPQISVSRKILKGCTVAVIEVEPSNNPPIRFDGRVWIRVGPRRAVATPEEERRLVEKRRWGNLPFDAQGVVGANLDDLDLARFELELLPAIMPPDVLEQNHRPREQQLTALRLTNRDGIPTNTGVLFLGKSPLSWIPGAFVQFRRVDGDSLTDISLDYHEISGTLPDQARRLDELLTINIRNRMIVGGPARAEQSDYPVEALRQLVRNALIHRTYEGTNAPVRLTWYNDRVEIQSPGGPYGQVTLENFGAGATDYRNPTVAGLMGSLRFMERFGVGIAIARKSLNENGNPPLEYQNNAQHVLAIVRPSR
jgi:ATP-dependent DNA helicase RecG